MGDEPGGSWLSSRTTTNVLLVVGIVVVASGFVQVGAIGPVWMQFVSESVLVLVFVVPIVLFLSRLLRTDET